MTREKYVVIYRQNRTGKLGAFVGAFASKQEAVNMVATRTWVSDILAVSLAGSGYELRAVTKLDQPQYKATHGSMKQLGGE